MNNADRQSPSPQSRKLLWATFWFVFLSTPMFAFFTPEFADHIAVLRSLTYHQLLLIFAGTLTSGGFLCGFLYAKISGVADAEFLGYGMKCGFFLTAIYFVLVLLVNGLVSHS
jgi:hypothetical protein